MRLQLRAFLEDRTAASAAEFALISIALMMLIFGTIDFGRLLWTWNQAEAATRAGARYAIVNDPVAVGIASVDGLALGYGNGIAIPASAVAGGSPIVCTRPNSGNASCTPNYGGASNTAFDNIKLEVQKFLPAVDNANIEIIYQHIGLGFSGNPFGSDIVPLVTVRIKDMTFDFITPGLVGVISIALPGFQAALIGEDIEN